MEIVNSYENVDKLKNNIIIGKFISNNSKIIFKGKGNILYCCGEDINLLNSNLVFNGDNAIIFLSKNKFNYISPLYK